MDSLCHWVGGSRRHAIPRTIARRANAQAAFAGRQSQGFILNAKVPIQLIASCQSLVVKGFHAGPSSCVAESRPSASV